MSSDYKPGDRLDDVAVRDIEVGDVLDLAGDRYADPDNDALGHAQLHFEYVQVGGVIPETPGCTVLCIDYFDWVGFPPDHTVKRHPALSVQGRRDYQED